MMGRGVCKDVGEKEGCEEEKEGERGVCGKGNECIEL